jgi:hypothetical protein
MIHGTIHIPSDVDYFGVGVERLSAWMDETFQGKMCQAGTQEASQRSRSTTDYHVFHGNRSPSDSSLQNNKAKAAAGAAEA